MMIVIRAVTIAQCLIGCSNAIKSSGNSGSKYRYCLASIPSRTSSNR